jgi:hypothetical protein
MIYFARNSKATRVKIGYTNDIARRLSSIRNRFKDELVIVLVVEGDKKDEARLHHHFARERFKTGRRRGREWFRLTKRIWSYVANNLHRSLFTVEEMFKLNQGTYEKAPEPFTFIA